MRNFSFRVKLINLGNTIQIPFDKEDIFNISNIQAFNAMAMKIFSFQAKNNTVYGEYLNAIKCNLDQILDPGAIPFLPIELFKHQIIAVSDKKPDLIFKSSGTGGQVSTHYILDAGIYQESIRFGFEKFYGTAKNYCFLALLPSYLERNNASLVHMMDQLMSIGRHPLNGFYLDDFEGLNNSLKALKDKKQPTVLVGVTYALLDFADKYQTEFPELIIMETGGMKGTRKEMLRGEIHKILNTAFHSEQIHSEYGMTELLSQAYSNGQGIFSTPPWMKIMIRDIRDPFSYVIEGKSGAINIIDLANINSCSFIATQDVGRMSVDGSFEVLGRMDNSDLRGCNLMIH